MKVLALSTGVGVVLLVLGAIFVIAAGGNLVLRGRWKEAGPDIPHAMKPGPADAALETPLLQRLQGWSVLLVAFMAIWIPLNWLREPSVNLQQEQAQEAAKIERGRLEVLLFSSESNQLGVGCVRCHGPELRGGVVQSGVNPDGSPRYIHPANLTTVCGGPNTGHPLIHNVEDIRTTIMFGRLAAGMPSWSVKGQGALDDQQIDDLVQYLVSLNRKTVPYSQNVCINPNAPGYVIPPLVPGAPTAAPSASPSGGGASASPSAGASASSSPSPSGG